MNETGSPMYENFSGHADQKFGHLTYSQNGEDLLIVSLFSKWGIENPSYLDIGANHPLNCSNTALLYRRGSRGVNVDANPDVMSEIEKYRPEDRNLNCGVAAQAGHLTFYRIDAHSGRNSFSKSCVEQFLAEETPGMGYMDEINVEIHTLDEIVDNYCAGKCPDFVSIDAENLDYEIIETYSFRTKPALICIETGQFEHQINARLAPLGYGKIIQMGGNGLYANRSWT